MALQEERQAASFNVLQMSKFLYGEEELNRMDRILQIVMDDPIFDRGDIYYLGRKDLYKRTIEKNYHMVRRLEELGLTDPKDVQLFRSYACQFEPLTGLHHAMFLPTLRGQMSDEQKAKWLPLAENYQILGTYGQTELGHGSNLKSIETTAVYDRETQTFILNTPEHSSMKWWPGGMAKSVTHTIVMARLIIDGKDYGFNSFICQIRSLEDHTTLPGITLGDIGPKFGIWSSIDNGRMELKNVRIPRENMLMKYAQVTPEGEYIRPPNSKLVYGTMVMVRAGITISSAEFLSKAITIAIRYSCVRRQGYLLGEVQKDQPEMKVMDYGSQQFALLPLLATSYALWFTSQWMMDLYFDLEKQIKNGEYGLLAEVHATSSGLKAITSWIAMNGIEEARQRCGGHGFLRSSALGDLYTGHLPACTYEGDNLVLCQQTARYMVKACRQVSSGKSIKGNAAYLNEILSQENTICPASKPSDFLDESIQLNCFTALAKFVAMNVFEQYEGLVKSGLSAKKAWNVVMPEFQQLTETHSYVILVKNFHAAVSRCEDSNMRNILKKLSDLFALSNLNRMSAVLLMEGYLSKKQVEMIKQNIYELLPEIRQDAVPLVDSWHHSDFILNSALGKYDGDVYQALYDESKKSVLNVTDVVDGYEEYIRPLIRRANL
eukprot:TRINITY_DN6718_c0_g1_i1.p1 TRINITY_DN6718_c0_g1~~TRINITY_DN6718_c0_g1_i1.p1  ORF type:complete len:662 (-),score=162.81 TRINITY_DN6718_c0_g1_i1:13-1998(-)